MSYQNRIRNLLNRLDTYSSRRSISLTISSRSSLATKQQNLSITPSSEAAITVDNIKVAQFIYLLLNNQEIREVIDTITSKAVLILGRFSEDRKRLWKSVAN